MVRGLHPANGPQGRAPGLRKHSMLAVNVLHTCVCLRVTDNTFWEGMNADLQCELCNKTSSPLPCQGQYVAWGRCLQRGAEVNEIPVTDALWHSTPNSPVASLGSRSGRWPGLALLTRVHPEHVAVPGQGVWWSLLTDTKPSEGKKP